MDTSQTIEVTTAMKSPQKSRTEQEIIKIFDSELQLFNHSRNIVKASRIGCKNQYVSEDVREMKMDNLIKEIKKVIGPIGKLSGPRRIAAEVMACESYYLILEGLTQIHTSEQYIKNLMFKAWEAVRDNKGIGFFSPFNKTEEALYWLYRVMLDGNIRFNKFHSHAQAHFALVEYRLRNGWLIDKYDAQWTKLQQDSAVVCKWASKAGIGLNTEAYRFKIADLHREITGRLHSGM